MKKILALMFILLLVLQFAAADFEIKKLSSDEVLIVGIDKPATFEMQMKNTGSADAFEFYNLVGLSMFPKGTTYFAKGQAKDIDVQVYPLEELKQRGLFTFQYYIRGQNNTEYKDELTVKIIELGEAFEAGSGELDPDSNSLEIYIKNRVNFEFKNMNADFSSAFFDFSENLTLAPYETRTFNVDIEKDDIKKLMAGMYTLTANVNVGNRAEEIEGAIKFLEKDLISTTKRDYGLFINTQIIEKENKGNVLSESDTVIKKNIISRLFTGFSPEPTMIERDGAAVFYTWNAEIPPGETLEIKVRTNWLLPLLAILFVVAVVIIVKKYSSTDLVLRKKVGFVRTKGGEFALRVTIRVNAKKYVERVNVIDRIPQLVKVHEKFGSEQPSRVNEKTRRIEWNYDKLEQGEVRILSYIVYSKVGILGKFVLQSATAIFEKDGKIKEAESNRAVFISESRGREGGD